MSSGKDENGYCYTEFEIENISDTPAYPVTVTLTDEQKRYFLNENFFMLKNGENKKLRITCDNGECGEIAVKAWNCNEITL